MSRRVNDWIEGFMKFSDRSEPPTLFKEWTAVSTIAAVLRRNVWLPWDGPVFPNHFILLVGPPTARKGTVLRYARDMLTETGIHMTVGKVTHEKFIQKLEDSTEGIPDHFDELGYDARMTCAHTVFSDEFTVFLGHRNEAFVDSLCSLYDSLHLWPYETKGSGTNVLEGVCVNLIGGTTPEAIRRAFPESAIGGGLTSRMILVWGPSKSKRVSRPAKTAEELELFTDLTHDLQEIMCLQGRFDATEEWLDLYDKFYEDQDLDPPIKDSKFLHYIGRRQVHLIKTSMVFSASRGDDLLLTGTDFHRAADLLTRTEADMPFALQGMGRVPYAQMMEPLVQYLQQNPRVPVSALLGYFRNDLEPSELNRLLEALQGARAIRIERNMGKEWVVLTPNEWKAKKAQEPEETQENPTAASG